MLHDNRSDISATSSPMGQQLACEQATVHPHYPNPFQERPTCVYIYSPYQLQMAKWICIYYTGIHVTQSVFHISQTYFELCGADDRGRQAITPCDQVADGDGLKGRPAPGSVTVLFYS